MGRLGGRRVGDRVVGLCVGKVGAREGEDVGSVGLRLGLFEGARLGDFEGECEGEAEGGSATPKYTSDRVAAYGAPGASAPPCAVHVRVETSSSTKTNSVA